MSCFYDSQGSYMCNKVIENMEINDYKEFDSKCIWDSYEIIENVENEKVCAYHLREKCMGNDPNCRFSFVFKDNKCIIGDNCKKDKLGIFGDENIKYYHLYNNNNNNFIDIGNEEIDELRNEEEMNKIKMYELEKDKSICEILDKELETDMSKYLNGEKCEDLLKKCTKDCVYGSLDNLIFNHNGFNFEYDNTKNETCKQDSNCRKFLDDIRHKKIINEIEREQENTDNERREEVKTGYCIDLETDNCISGYTEIACLTDFKKNNKFLDEKYKNSIERKLIWKENGNCEDYKKSDGCPHDFPYRKDSYCYNKEECLSNENMCSINDKRLIPNN